MLRMGWGAVLSMETTTTSTSERPGSGSRAKWKRTRKPCWSYTVTGKMLPSRGDGERLKGAGGRGRGRGAKPEPKHIQSALHTRLTPGLAPLLGMNEKTQTQCAALTLGSSAVRGIVWGQDGQVDF